MIENGRRKNRIKKFIIHKKKEIYLGSFIDDFLDQAQMNNDNQHPKEININKTNFRKSL